jgi:predicted RNA-binding Zn-ribbon protein involved in translation (DUF1610 family)
MTMPPRKVSDMPHLVGRITWECPNCGATRLDVIRHNNTMYLRCWYCKYETEPVEVKT